MKVIGCLFIFIIIQLPTRAQTELESLKVELSSKKVNSTEYFETLNKMVKEYAAINPDTALIICRAILAESDKNKINLATTYYSFSVVFHYLAQYDSSTYYSFKAIDEAEKLKDTLAFIAPLNNIGVNFLYQEDYQNAKNYFSQVAELAIRINDSSAQAHALNNLGMVAGYQDNIETELIYYQQAGEIFSELNDPDGLGNAVLNSGTAYTIIGRYQAADTFYDSALTIFQKANINSGVVAVILSKAENFIAQGKYRLAYDATLQANELAIANSFIQDEIYGYELLDQIFTSQKMFDSAYIYQHNYFTTKEKVFNLERSKQIQELEKKYEAVKRQREIDQLTAQNKIDQQEKFSLIIISSLLGLVAIALAVIFYLKSKQSKLQHRLLNEEIEGLRIRISKIYSEVKLNEVEEDLSKIQKAFHNDLTEREAEILQQAVTNKTNAEIADVLHLSVNTVKYHLKNVYNKIGVSSRLEARQVMVGE